MTQDIATCQEPEFGPVAVVTGASAGLGRSLSIELARQGCRVVGMARRFDVLEEIGRLCPPGRFRSVRVDVADPLAVSVAFDQIERTLGAVEILIANAAIYPRQDLLTQHDAPVFEVLATNLGGQLSCAVAALKHMVPAGAGRILIVGSFAGAGPIPGSLGYSVSKGGGRVLAQALAVETAGRMPGIVISEWIPPILATQIGLPDGADPDIAAKWCARLALDRDPALHGKTFLGPIEHRAPQSILRKMRGLLTLRRPAPLRRLDGPEP